MAEPAKNRVRKESQPSETRTELRAHGFAVRKARTRGEALERVSILVGEGQYIDVAFHPSLAFELEMHLRARRADRVLGEKIRRATR